jgi:hypothetical protein
MRKFSEIPQLESLDVLVEITPYVKALASRDSLIDEFKAIATATDDERSAADFSATIVARLVPVWLKECRAELLEIIRIINGVSEDEMSKVSGVKVFEEIGELFSDTDFMRFFRSFVVQKPTE